MISLICANPVGAITRRLNPGMLTVDYAFHQFAARHFPKHPVTAFTLGELSDWPGDGFGLPFGYRDYAPAFEEVTRSAAIVFWGDFLHARAFELVDMKKRRVPPEVVRSHLFLEGCGPEIFRKVIAFGGSLICNCGRDAYDREYRARAGRFFREAPHVYLRDTVSDMKARSLAGAFGRSCLGADCALLFDADAAPRGPEPASPRDGGIGVFFGRTALNMRRFFDLARKLAGHQGRGLRWLHWLPLFEDAARMLDREAADVARGPAPRSIGEIYAQFRGLDCIVTDTYHLSLIAWRMGVPALCIGEGARRKQTTIDDKKKEVFFSSYGAEPFYVYAERLSDPAWIEAAARRLSRLLADGEIPAAVRQNLLAHAAWAEQTLKRCLDEVLR